ncbi:hypothetical protein [Paenibacillus baekrokdamisoli]|nr:hypothetical protein [Paenibacillus baekrokdamisoli]
MIECSFYHMNWGEMTLLSINEPMKKMGLMILAFVLVCTTVMAGLPLRAEAAATQKLLHAADSSAGWSGAQVDTTDKKEGTASLKGVYKRGPKVPSYDGNVEMNGKFTAVDTKLSVANGQLIFWIYISNAALLGSGHGEIEISSANQIGKDAYRWNTADLSFVEGWQQLKLNVSDADVLGNPDLSAIKRFGIQVYATSQFVLKIDDIRMQNKLPKVLSLHNGDSTAGWIGATLDTANKKEGAASLSTVTDPIFSLPGYPGITLMQYNFSPVDTGVTVEKGYLKLWLYLDDVSKFAGFIGTIELSSNANPDVDEYEWLLSSMHLQSGWQELTLKLSDANAYGNPDLSAISRIRIYCFNTTTATMKVDDIRIYEGSSGAISIQDANQAYGWTGGALDTADKKEGGASYAGTSDPGITIPGYTGAANLQSIFDPIDTGATLQNGRLKMWLYISDVSRLSANRVGSIELSSNHATDVDEIEWRLSDLQLINGWQELTLRVNQAQIHGNPDLRAITRFRVYGFSTDEIRLKVDDIRMTSQGGGTNPGAGGTAAYTGEEMTIAQTDPTYGGPQLVGKLFTEGLGRLPEPAEYKAAIGFVEQHGASVATFESIIHDFFEDVRFTGSGLTTSEQAQAIYRAVLNRDPSLAEVSDYSSRLVSETAGDIAAALTGTAEFAALLPDIIKGPYYWGANNAQLSTGGVIMTAAQVQALLDGPDTVIELPRGTLVLADQTINVPAGKTLRTAGTPTHYVQKARVLRAANVNTPLVTIQGGGTLSHMWVDGNRTAFLSDPGGLKYGHNIVTMGHNVNVISNRLNDATAGTNLFGADLMKNAYIAHNLITAYASSHYVGVNGGWSDGITHASTDSIIEDNQVVDATDVGIIVFRFVSLNHDVPQTTIVRNNTVVNFGNSAYAALDIDSWHSQGAPQLFSGTSIDNNAIWTSMKAHHHITLSFAPLAWTSAMGDTAIGGSMTNNYTPDGLYVLTAAGIAVDGVRNFNIRGNRLNMYVGPWNNTGFNTRLISVNENNSSGSIQGPYVDDPMHRPGQGGFISSGIGEPFTSVTVKHAHIHDVYP